jgi:hypothetical protein
MKYIGDYKKFENVMSENDADFILTKIIEKFSKEEVNSNIKDETNETDIETTLIDMICWFEENYNRDIVDEDLIIKKLREYYQI